MGLASLPQLCLTMRQQLRSVKKMKRVLMGAQNIFTVSHYISTVSTMTETYILTF
jgi:hypothetical protein